MDLRQLWEARAGRPTESEAAGKIATFAVIPAVIVGLLAGSRLVDAADPIGQFLAVCIATAFGSGLGVAFLVLGVYYFFGFRPVAVLADALAGGFVGLLAGGTVTLLLLWLKLVHHDHALWALLMIPLGAVAVPLWQWQREKRRVRRVAGRDGDAQSAEPH